MFVFLVAAGAAVWGTFEKIQFYVHKYAEPIGGAAEYRFSMTWWAQDVSGPAGALPVDWFPPFGALPAVGAGLIVVAAVLALTAFAGRRAGVVTAVRVCAGVGGGLLAGVVAVRLLDALQVLHQTNAEKLDPGETNDFQMGLGIFLPGGAAALALIGLAVTINRGRAGRVEPDTPRMGIPMPYPPQQYQPYVQQPVSQPTPVQQAQPVIPHPEQPNPPAE